MILHSLTLKNFKGLLAGVGLPEVTIDFDKLPATGIIAVVGSNGMGKTTLLDNMHPFRLMPYKLRKSPGWSEGSFNAAGGYYGECVGEAKKELIFSMGGVRYKSTVLIDVDRRKQEATLYRALASSFSDTDWSPLNDGKTSTYDEAIVKVCGSPSLFFSSVFRAQGAKNLSDYTRGDIMSVVAELLNIDRIKEQGEKARKVATALTTKVSDLSLTVSAMRADAEMLPSYRLALEESDAGIKAALAEQAEYAGEATALGDKKQEMEVASAAEASTRQRIRDKKVILDALRTELRVGGGFPSQLSMLSGDRAAAVAAREGEITTFSAAATRFGNRSAELTKIMGRSGEARTAAEVLPEMKQQNEAQALVLAGIRESYAGLREKVAALSSVALELASAERNLVSLRARSAALTGLDCKGDTSGWINEQCRLLQDAVAAQKDLPTVEAEVTALKLKGADKAALDQHLQEVKTKGETEAAILKNMEATLAEVAAVAALLPQIEAAEAQLAGIRQDELHLRDTHVATMAGHDQRIKEVDGRIAEVTAAYEAFKTSKSAEIGTAESEIAQLEQAIGGDLATVLADLDRKLATVRSLLQSCDVRLDDLRLQRGRALSRIEVAEAADSKVAEVDARIAGLQEEIASWKLMVMACSNDGIIALEIDDAGPGIAVLCNDLLRIYSSRYSIRLETQTEKVGGGAKEDFDITVFDADTGETKSISAMSGGQITWIEDALTRAICLFNIGRSDRVFGTIYSDEKDGALDPDKKVEFMAVKRRSLEVGSHSRELFITQTAELVNMADGVIRLSPGKVDVS